MNATHLKLIVRKDRKNIDGSSSIYLYANVNGQVKYFSTNKSVKIEHWNQKKQEVRSIAPYWKEINESIKDFINKAENLISKANFEGRHITTNNLEQFLRASSFNTLSYYDFVSQYITNYASSYKPKTLIGYQTHLNKLKEFRQSLYFSQINVIFWKNYESHLLSKKNQVNTIHKQSKLLKKFLNKAVDFGIIEANPLKEIRVKHQEGNREFLTIDELNRLERIFRNSELKKFHTQNVLRAFLFACYTGLRYSDMRDLKQKNLFNRENPELAELRLEIFKTRDFLTIPLNNRALNLVIPSDFPNSPIFKIYANQVMNRALKEIARFAGIDKKLSFHCARHTAATLYLELSGNIAAVQKILGHTNIKTTMIYAKLTDKKKRETVNLLDVI